MPVIIASHIHVVLGIEKFISEIECIGFAVDYDCIS